MVPLLECVDEVSVPDYSTRAFQHYALAAVAAEQAALHLGVVLAAACALQAEWQEGDDLAGNQKACRHRPTAKWSQCRNTLARAPGPLP
jgi:hypothetical protein